MKELFFSFAPFFGLVSTSFSSLFFAVRPSVRALSSISPFRAREESRPSVVLGPALSGALRPAKLSLIRDYEAEDLLSPGRPDSLCHATAQSFACSNERFCKSKIEQNFSLSDWDTILVSVAQFLFGRRRARRHTHTHAKSPAHSKAARKLSVRFRAASFRAFCNSCRAASDICMLRPGTRTFKQTGAHTNTCSQTLESWRKKPYTLTHSLTQTHARKHTKTATVIACKKRRSVPTLATADPNGLRWSSSLHEIKRPSNIFQGVSERGRHCRLSRSPVCGAEWRNRPSLDVCGPQRGLAQASQAANAENDDGDVDIISNADIRA